jgi:small subunit ribosomal protein S2
MLTNFQTIHGRLRRLKELREMERSGAFEFLPKKEVLKLRHEKEKLDRNLSGIQDMERVPDALYVIDTKREQIAVKEARKLGIPVLAIVDTNCDPDEVDYVIPGNDDAIRACSLITKVVADAIQEGQYLAYKTMQGRPPQPEFEQEPAAPPSEAPSEEPARRPVQLSEEEASFFGASLDESASARGTADADEEGQAPAATDQASEARPPTEAVETAPPGEELAPAEQPAPLEEPAAAEASPAEEADGEADPSQPAP